MKKFFKFGCLGVIALIVIGIIVAVAGGGDDTSKTSSETKDKTTESASKEKPKDKAKEEKTYKIGDKITVGDMEYTVTKLGTADSVGPSVLPTNASGKYVVLDVTLKNNGNEAVTIDTSFFKLQRGDKTYEADASASMSANQGEDGAIDNSFFLQSLNPDSEISGKVVFDVAEEVASANDLSVQVQTGVFGTETGVIGLQ